MARCLKASSYKILTIDVIELFHKYILEINGYGDFRLTGLTITSTMYAVHLSRFNISHWSILNIILLNYNI